MNEKEVSEVTDLITERVLLDNRTFNTIKAAFIDENHYYVTAFREIITRELKVKEVLKEGELLPAEYVKYFREKLWEKSISYFSLPPNTLTTAKDEYNLTQIKKNLDYGGNIQLPQLSVNLETCIPKIRTESLKKLFLETLEQNMEEINTLKIDLMDALASTRKSKRNKIIPLEKANSQILEFLDHWEDENFKVTTPTYIELRPMKLDSEYFQKIGDFLIIQLENFKIDSILARYAVLESWVSKQLDSIDVDSIKVSLDCLNTVEDIQNEARKMSSTIKQLREICYAIPEKDKNIQVPSLKFVVRTSSKTNYQALSSLLKSQIEVISTKNDIPELEKESQIKSMKSDLKFAKLLLNNWEKKMSICRKKDEWCIYAPAYMKNTLNEEELHLVRSKLIDSYFFVHQKQYEFQKLVENEMNEIATIFNIGYHLNIWSIESINLSLQKKIDKLKLKAKKLRADKKAIPKPLALPNKKGGKPMEIPSLTLKITKVESGLLKEIHAYDLKQIEALQSQLQLLNKKKRKKAQKKEKSTIRKSMNDLEKSLSELQKHSDALLQILENWNDRNNLAKQLKLTHVTAPQKLAKYSDLTKEEQRTLELHIKKQTENYEKLIGQSNTKIKAVKKQLESLLQKSGEKTKTFETLRDSLLKLTETHMENAIRYTQYISTPESLLEIQITKENATYLMIIWKSFISKLFKDLEEATSENNNSHADQQQMSNHNNHNHDQQNEHLQRFEIMSMISFTKEQITNSIIEFTPDQNKELLHHLEDLEAKYAAHLSPAVAIKKQSSSKLNGSGLVNGLNEIEKKGLLLITRCFDTMKHNQILLSTNERKDIFDFLEHATNNHELNLRLSEMSKAVAIPFGISNDAVNLIRTFSFKSRHLRKLSTLTTKLQRAWEKVNEKQEISKSEKISLKELGILRTMEKWGKDLELLAYKFGLVTVRDANDECHSMMKLLETAVSSHRVLKNLYSSIQTAINDDQTYQSGDFLLAIWEYKQQTMQGNRPPRTFKFLMSFTKYEHTAKLYRNLNTELGTFGELRMSHMYREYHDSSLTIEDIACGEIFRLDVPSLIPQKYHDALIQKYGENWNVDVRRKYYEIESQFHSDNQDTLGNITNPISRVLGIGTAAIMPWTKKKKKDQNFEQLREILSSSKLEMTCSEFAAVATIINLLQLNDHLKGELNLNKKIIRVPFPPKEKFDTMQPERLREILLNKNVLEPIQCPKFISDIIKKSHSNK